MKSIWNWHFGLRTASEANMSEHWSVAAKRHKQQKMLLRKVFLAEKPPVKLPCKVTLTRIAPKSLDEGDNLPCSFKYIRDTIADYIIPNQAAGRADDCKEIEWAYRQKKGDTPRQYGFIVEIES